MRDDLNLVRSVNCNGEAPSG